MPYVSFSATSETMRFGKRKNSAKKDESDILTHGVIEVAHVQSPIIRSFSIWSYKIEEGLKRLREVKPAGETYMHEGISEVRLISQLHWSTLMIWSWNSVTFKCFHLVIKPSGISSDTKTDNQIL